MIEALLLLTLALPLPLPFPALQGEPHLDAYSAAVGAPRSEDALVLFDGNRKAARTRAGRNNLTALGTRAHDLTSVGSLGGVNSPHAPEHTPQAVDAVGSLGRVGNPFKRPVATMQEEQGKPDYVLRTGAVFLASLTVAEIEVTRAVIERGGRELNALYKPFEQHPGVLGLVNGALTGGLGLVALELNRRGKKTEARVFVWAMVAVKAVVFTHNVRELRKSGR